MFEMKTFQQFISEGYANELGYLLDYLKKKPLSWGNYQYDVAKWICEDEDRKEEAAKILKLDADDMDEDGEWVHDLDVYQLPNKWEAEFTKWWKEERLDYEMQHNPAETPTWAHLDLNQNKVLPNTTWLVHFCDDPAGVSKEGFKFGTDDIETLGLTTYLHQSKKRHGGYNFAFEAGSWETTAAERQGKYGKNAVMFQSSGVEVTHYGDEEDQIIFWGPSVHPKDIIQLYRDDEGWGVFSSSHKKSQGQDSKNGAVFHGETFDAVEKWVMKNAQQYRKVLTGR